MIVALDSYTARGEKDNSVHVQQRSYILHGRMAWNFASAVVCESQRFTKHCPQSCDYGDSICLWPVSAVHKISYCIHDTVITVQRKSYVVAGAGSEQRGKEFRRQRLTSSPGVRCSGFYAPLHSIKLPPQDGCLQGGSLLLQNSSLSAAQHQIEAARCHFERFRPEAGACCNSGMQCKDLA